MSVYVATSKGSKETSGRYQPRVVLNIQDIDRAGTGENCAGNSRSQFTQLSHCDRPMARSASLDNRAWYVR